MAAELEQLVHALEQRGLGIAALHLDLEGWRLRRNGFLPPTLNAPGVPDLTVVPTDDNIGARLNSYCGGLRLGAYGQHLPLAEQYPIDTLALPKRQRTALIVAGVSTIAELRYFADNNLLTHINNVGQLGAASIREALRRATDTPDQ